MEKATETANPTTTRLSFQRKNMACEKQNMKANDIKWVKSIGMKSSPGKKRHVRQMLIDRQLTNVNVNGIKVSKLHKINPLLGKARHQRQMPSVRHLENVDISGH